MGSGSLAPVGDDSLAPVGDGSVAPVGSGSMAPVGSGSSAPVDGGSSAPVGDGSSVLVGGKKEIKAKQLANKGATGKTKGKGIFPIFISAKRSLFQAISPESKNDSEPDTKKSC